MNSVPISKIEARIKELSKHEYLKYIDEQIPSWIIINELEHLIPSEEEKKEQEPSTPISKIQKLLEEEWNGTSDADYRLKADTLKEAIERFCKEKEKHKEQE
jgi:hypothetical protein